MRIRLPWCFSKSQDKKSKAADEENISDKKSGESTSAASAASTQRSSRKYVPKDSTNIALVAKALELWNSHDLEGYLGLHAPNCEVRFSGMDTTIAIKDFVPVMQDALASFPNFRIDGDKPREVGPGVVVVKNLVATGSHTGKPFGFGPCPPLPATGVKCRNDPEEVTYFIVNGKIGRVHIHSSGKLTGPLGFYQQIKEGNKGVEKGE